MPQDTLQQGTGRRRPWRVALILVVVVAAAALALTTRSHPPRRPPTPVATATPRPMGTPVQRLAGTALRADSAVRLTLGGGSQLRELTVPAGTSRRVPVGGPVQQLVARRDGPVAVLAAPCLTCRAAVVATRTGRSLGRAMSIVPDAVSDRLWLVDRLGPERVRMSLVTDTGRVIRPAREVAFSGALGGTSRGVLGYSSARQSLQLWDPTTGHRRDVAQAAPPVPVGSGGDTVAWTDFGPVCQLRCVHLARVGASVSIQTLTLPTGAELTLQPERGAVSPDGRRLVVLTYQIANGTARGAPSDASVQVLYAELRDPSWLAVPGARLDPDLAGAAVSMAWSLDSRTLWLGEADDRGGHGTEVARWPLHGPLQLTRTTATEVSLIAPG